VVVPIVDSWRFCVQTETVTLLHQGVSTAVPGVWRSASNRDETVVDPAMMESVMGHFHLWTERLPAGLTPTKGDRVTAADGSVWLVIRSEILGHGTRHRLHCLLDRKA